MSFLDKYNEEINYLWNDVLKEELIQSFVNFYGIEYEYKIREVIENLVIIRLERNLGKEKFQQKSDEFLNKMEKKVKFILDELKISYVDDDKFISKCRIIAEKDIQWFDSLIRESNLTIHIDEFLLLKKYYYMWQYYMEIENIDFKNKFGIVGRNVDTTKYDSLLEVGNDEAGVFYSEVKDCILTSLCDYGINLGTLIHEINHSLSREFLAHDYQNDKDIMQLGFLNVGDFFYEIINDYIAKDIFNDLNSKLTHDFDYLIKRKKYSSGYMDLDDICSNPIQQVYIWSKSLITNSLIEGKGYVFVNVIGQDNYDNLNHLLIGVYDNFKRIKEKEIKVKKEQIKLVDKKKKMFDLYLGNIYENLKKYNQYNKNLEQQLEEMEKKGTIRRI